MVYTKQYSDAVVEAYKELRNTAYEDNKVGIRDFLFMYNMGYEMHEHIFFSLEN